MRRLSSIRYEVNTTWSAAQWIPSARRGLHLPLGRMVLRARRRRVRSHCRAASEFAGGAPTPLLTGLVGGTPATGRLEQTRCARLRGIRQTAPYLHNNNAATLDEVVDHYIEFFKFVKANQPPGVVPPVVSTDGINFDRQLRPDERQTLPAYLRKLWTFLA